MRSLIFALIALISLVPATLFAQATPTPVPSPLSSYNWSTGASPSLAINPPPIDTVRTFSNLDTGNAEGMVCAVSFANFRNSGNLTLIAGHCGGTIDIVDRTAGGFEWRMLNGLPDASDDVSTGVQDLLGNGTSELVLHSYLTYGDGFSHCSTVWPTIYAWTNSNYANVSTQAQYASWYQNQLSSLQAQLAASPTDCLKAEVAKVQRILGTPDAGTSDATSWAASADAGTRVFAAQVLADIDTPTSLGVLQTLTSDSTPLVADIATGLSENPIRQAPANVTQQTIPNPGIL
jgi:hypothetical protein